MYSIHRVSHGSRTFVTGNISNLDEALASAQQLRHADEEQGVKYIVMLASHKANPKQNGQNQVASSSPTQRKSTSHNPQKGKVSRTNKTKLNSRAARNPSRLTRSQVNAVPKPYSIERVVDGRSTYVVGDFDTLEEAYAKVTQLLSRGERAKGARLRVVENMVENEFVATKPDIWGLDDRRGDISLAVRQEDELGLGIPAQWGKGRRNRKGEYIP